MSFLAENDEPVTEEQINQLIIEEWSKKNNANINDLRQQFPDLNYNQLFESLNIVRQIYEWLSIEDLRKAIYFACLRV